MTTLPELARDYVQKMISRAGPGAKVILDGEGLTPGTSVRINEGDA